MQKLIAGIHQFQKDAFRSRRELFERLAEGQSPDTLLITCSDSRISPSLITQTDPGELFILRNAGNIVPPYGASSDGAASTIEYAVAALGVKDIIVCGHTHCGAMKALLQPESLAELPATKQWLSHAEITRRIVSENYKHLEGPARVTATVQENVLGQLENLRTHPTVAAAIARGKLRLHGWVYKIETGQVFAYDPEGAQFETITESRHMNGAHATSKPRSGASL